MHQGLSPIKTSETDVKQGPNADAMKVLVGRFRDPTVKFKDMINTRGDLMRQRLVSSLKYGSLLQNIGLFCGALLQKRHIFLESLQNVGTP